MRYELQERKDACGAGRGMRGRRGAVEEERKEAKAEGIASFVESIAHEHHLAMCASGTT